MTRPIVDRPCPARSPYTQTYRRAVPSAVDTSPHGRSRTRVSLDRFTGVLLFDLDHFKVVNDRYGHATGDEVLRRFALVMRQCLRTTDIAARLGGEEFAAVLPRSTAERAHQVAERIRKSLADLVVETDLGDMQCTVSVGIAFPTGEGRMFEQVLGDADKALYRAKNSGRNRVASASLRLAG